MSTAFDAIVEIFTWIGFGGAVAFGGAALVVWAIDGTWLPAQALVDHESDGTWVRWYDTDGEANSARADAHTAQALTGLDRASVWYRHGWRGRMRLERRPPIFRVLRGLALGSLAVGTLSVVVSLVALFAVA